MRTLDRSPAVHRTVVSDRREPVPGIAVLGLIAPRLAEMTLPGQFAMAIPPGGGQAATALGIYEAEGTRISLMLVIVGPRTHELAALPTGASLDLIGPLGNGFELDSLGENVALIAGGVGIASLLLPAQRLASRGKRLTLLYGARTADALVDVNRFSELGAKVACATDDGTRGHSGFVTDLLRALPKHAFSGIAACGPSPMLRAVGRAAAYLEIPAQLALEETFACGVGACWGCVVPHAASSVGAPIGLIGAPPQAAPRPPHAKRVGPPTREIADFSYVRVCKEGPGFWAHELRW